LTESRKRDTQGIERQYFTEPCAQRDLGSDSTIITFHFISNSMLTDIQGKEIKPEPAVSYEATVRIE
jgi:hypothetical protein